ncbi:MAG: AsnC family transcriptional regulator [Rhodobacterales bacterium]|nr:MAG: AsnC family transcriptional regulator [Rhodobacterales bacterium]
MELDKTDRRILTLLQRDARLTSSELGERLALSASQAGRRRQRLEDANVITRVAAQLDPEYLGLAVQAFVQVQLAEHGAEVARSFAAMIARHDEVVSAWTMTGEADYLLRIWCADLKALHRLIHEELLAHPAVARVQSQIVMDQLKADAPLPVTG